MRVKYSQHKHKQNSYAPMNSTIWFRCFVRNTYECRHYSDWAHNSRFVWVGNCNSILFHRKFIQLSCVQYAMQTISNICINNKDEIHFQWRFVVVAIPISHECVSSTTTVHNMFYSIEGVLEQWERIDTRHTLRTHHFLNYYHYKLSSLKYSTALNDRTFLSRGIFTDIPLNQRSRRLFVDTSVIQLNSFLRFSGDEHEA